MEDEQNVLAERARQGDAAAFDRLVSLHRTRVLRLARRIVHDPSEAEDVVQDALVQAFLHISGLADAGRFVPWLDRIVRNQALMKRRKDGRRSRETTFTGLSGGPAGELPDGNAGGTLDIVLHRMTQSREREEDGDPEGGLLRSEFYTALKGMLNSLSSRERDIFEAHFLNSLDPKEIALLLGATEGSVYKSLSRSKAKVREERTRGYVRDRLGEEAIGSARPARVLLPGRFADGSRQRGIPSIASCFLALCRFGGGLQPDITDVMGWSGQAFRLNLERSTIDVSGPSMYFWEPVFEAGLRRLGFDMTHAGDGGIAPSAYMLGEAAALARRTIASGMPAVAWDVEGPEFGLLYGYDDGKMVFTAAGRGREGLTVPYDKLGRGAGGGLFVLAGKPRPGARRDADDEARRLIMDLFSHAYGERTFAGYAAGLAAYDSWREALRSGDADPLGHAYCAELALHAREHACRFLRRWAAQWDGERGRLAFEAEGHYYEAAGRLARVADRFPFPGGGDPLDRTAAAEAAELLAQAKSCEEAGIETLGRLARLF